MSDLMHDIERLSDEARDMMNKAEDAIGTLDRLIDKIGTIEDVEEYSNEEHVWAYDYVRRDLYEVSSAFSEVRDYADALEGRVDNVSDDVNDKIAEYEGE